MKKILSIILGISFSAMFFAGTALAQEDDQVKVYLTEPIGAGINVNVVTRCLKEPQKAVLKCNDMTVNQYGSECQKTEGGVTKTLYNKPIFQCVNRNDEAVIDRTGNECKQEHTEFFQKPIYGNVYAVIICPDDQPDVLDEPAEDKCKVLEYITHEGDSPPTDEYIVKAEPKKTLQDKYAQKLSEARASNLFYFQQYALTVCESLEFDEKDYGPFAGTDPEANTMEIFGRELPNQCSYEYYKVQTKDNQCSTLKPDLLGENLGNIGECAFSCKRGERISGESGVDLITKFIAAVYRWTARIVGIVAVLVIVFSGIEISMAGSQAEKIEEAKKRIFMSLAGLAILFLSGLILYTINPNFFV